LAISPPSDIVLDVVNAVDRAEAAAAHAELARRAGITANAESFSPAPQASPPRALPAASAPARDPLMQFEAVVLQTFLETMLPPEAENIYGRGLAGEMWKSLLAGQMAESMAARGGIGIAERLRTDFYREGEVKVPLVGATNNTEGYGLDAQLRLSAVLVQQFERGFLDTLSTADGSKGGD
jgi:Rod binding domain-containing protein